MSSVRIRGYVVVAFLGCAFLATAGAETIHLKNGRTIFADSVREVNGRVEYTIGENTFALPKSSVLSIDTGGSPIVTHSEDIPAVNSQPKLALTNGSADEIAAHLIVDGKLDTDFLSAVEREGNPEKTAYTYSLASQFEVSKARFDAAARYIERANTFFPDNAVILTNYASILLRLARWKEAEMAADRATRIAPTEASGYAVLGYALFQQGKPKEAVVAFKKSLQLRSDPAIQSLLDKAQRELATEGDFAQENSSHFSMRYEGGQAPPIFRREILLTLEHHFDDIARDLGYVPRENIIVVLYNDKQYFDVTQAPSWAGAVNDGKLRMPISGLTGMTGELSRVLKHELTHSFISQITRDRCPTWLNEGIAQLEEPRSAASDGSRLARLYSAQRNIPLNQLEASFTRFSGPEATVAYAQSLLAAEYIRTTYGMSDLAGILKRLGDGQSTESALRSTIRSGYGQLEQELTAYLKRSYGD